MSGKHKPRPLHALRVDRRAQGFGDGDGDTRHVAETLMRQAGDAFAMKHRARDLRADAFERRTSFVAAHGDPFAGVPPDDWLAVAERIAPQPASERHALLDAVELELEALALDDAADNILATITAKIARAFDLAARAEVTAARRDAANRAKGVRTQENFGKALDTLRAKGLEVTTANVRKYWPRDAVPVTDDHIRTLMGEWKIRCS